MSAEIDRSALVGLKEMMGERFVSLVESYLKNSKIYLEAINDGIVQGDKKKIIDAAHPFKSSSASMGAVRVSEIADAIEEKAEDGVDMDDLSLLATQLNEAFQVIELEMQALA